MTYLFDVQNPSEGAAVGSASSSANPACRCRHSLGAHHGGKRCLFCGCVEFQVEEPVDPQPQPQGQTSATVLELVAQQPAFRNVDWNHLLEMARRGQPRGFRVRMPLIEEGDASDCIFLIMAGRAKVECYEQGLMRHLADVGPGDFVGEMGTLSGVPRMASVTASEDVRALELDLEDIRDIFRQHADLVHAFSRLIRQRQAH